MPQEDAKSMLRLIEEPIAASNIEVHHKDALIRLRQLLEEEFVAEADSELWGNSGKPHEVVSMPPVAKHRSSLSGLGSGCP
jgi:hypothetical protein